MRRAAFRPLPAAGARTLTALAGVGGRARFGLGLLAIIGTFAGTFAALERRARAEVLVVLDYQVASSLENCPNASNFRQEIAGQIGRDPFREAAPRRLLVRLYTVGVRMAARVEWRDASDQWEGDRVFSSRNESCAQMARSVALATAIQIQLLENLELGTPAQPVEAKVPPPPPPPVRPEPPAVTPPAVVEKPQLPPPPSSPSDIRIDVTVGAGVIQDLSDSPAFVVPRLAVAVARASSVGLRVAASGFGPGAEASRTGGSAQLDRLLITLEATRGFRATKLIQPMLAAGAGWQNVGVKGNSAMPTIAAGHDGHSNSAVVAVGGGAAFAVATRLSLIIEAEALLYVPSLTVQVASAPAARFAGVALFAHGGLLAHF